MSRESWLKLVSIGRFVDIKNNRRRAIVQRRDKPFTDVSATSIIDLAPDQERSNTYNCFISRKGSPFKLSLIKPWIYWVAARCTREDTGALFRATS